MSLIYTAVYAVYFLLHDYNYTANYNIKTSIDEFASRDLHSIELLVDHPLS